MKPNFALSLSFEGIGLLCRTTGGWHHLGEVALDDPNLAGALRDLRATASGSADDTILCKLIIPNDQIKYLSLDISTTDSDTLNEVVLHALDGATPYAVEDLSFDVTAQDAHCQIAAVAKETLQEAEAFATEHGFNPVCFVAIPADGDFSGEPFFGASAQSESILAANVSPMPDGEAVTVVSSGPLIVESQDEPVALAEEPPIEAPVSVTKDEKVEHSFASIRASRGLDDSAAAAPAVAAPAALPPQSTLAPDIQVPAEETLGGNGVEEDFEHTLRFDPAAIAASLKASSDTEQTPDAPAERGGMFRRRSKGGVGVVSAEADTTVAPISDAQKMTVFGSREKPKKEIGGKPRFLGLILTLLLLAFLAGVAIWATIFTKDGLAGLLGFGAPEQIAQSADEAVDVNVETLAPVSGDTVTDTAEIEALDTSEEIPELPAVALPLDGEKLYAATGIWDTVPQQPHTPGIIALDDLYVASIDTVSTSHDAIALPALSQVQPDKVLAPLASPAAAGTTFDFDERGLVVATQQGSVTPEGFVVYAGRPSVLPPQFPTRNDAPESSVEQSVNAALTAALAAKRPKLRPTTLVEQNERATLAGRSRDELASIRPKLRPENAKTLAEGDQTATKQAVIASLKPKSRPANFVEIIAKSQASGSAVAVPASASLTPGIPTTASVARQATLRNSINLRKVNLIGVYGSASERRALVRLSNGRYKKVQVGDRIDGGRVSAIAETELRYVKSGQNLVLKLPKG